MSDATPENLIKRLDQILEQEKLALLGGDLDEIARSAKAKGALIDELNKIAPSNQLALKDLQNKVARNQALLDGALQGIRKVAVRLAALRKIRRSLDTYDCTGQKQTIQGEIAHKMEKRA